MSRFIFGHRELIGNVKEGHLDVCTSSDQIELHIAFDVEDGDGNGWVNLTPERSAALRRALAEAELDLEMRAAERSTVRRDI